MEERNRNTDTGPPNMKHQGVNKPPIVHDNSKTISHPNEAPPVVTHKPTIRTVGSAMTKSNPGSPEQHATTRMPCKTTPTTRATCIGFHVLGALDPSPQSAGVEIYQSRPNSQDRAASQAVHSHCISYRDFGRQIPDVRQSHAVLAPLLPTVAIAAAASLVQMQLLRPPGDRGLTSAAFAAPLYACGVPVVRSRTCQQDRSPSVVRSRASCRSPIHPVVRLTIDFFLTNNIVDLMLLIIWSPWHNKSNLCNMGAFKRKHTLNAIIWLDIHGGGCVAIHVKPNLTLRTLRFRDLCRHYIWELSRGTNYYHRNRYRTRGRSTLISRIVAVV